MYRIKRFSYIHLSEKSFDDSENKDSGFNWGKALGTAAAIGGTMYGAKKGVFGNTVRRGYNTAYGHVGNIIGSKNMIKSAANDWAKGSVKGPGLLGDRGKYKRDLVNKRNEFLSNFNSNQKADTATAVTATMPTSDSNVSTVSKKSQNTTTTTIAPTATQSSINTITESANPITMATGSSAQTQSPQISARQQRLSTGQSAENYKIAKELGYKTEKTVKPKLNFQEREQERIKSNNMKNAGLMGISNPDSNTFYATPEMFKQKTMSILSKKRYFSSIMLDIF